MESEQRVQQDDNKQARKWPPRGLWITSVIVIGLIIVSIITTIWLISVYHPDTSTQITILSVLAAIVLGLPGLMFAYFQWFYPRPSDEHRPSPTHSSNSSLPPIIIQVPTHQPVRSQSPSADVAGKSQSSIPKITI